MSGDIKHKVKRSLSSRLSQKAANHKKNKINEECESLIISAHELDKDQTKNVIKILPENKQNNIVEIPGNRLTKSFYDQPCVKLAQALLGKVLVRKLPTGEVLRGRIVETECYLGSLDKASHSYNGKRTERNGAMFMQSGTSYVYTIYGMYFCFNISSPEEGSAVLIRAAEPLQNTSTMQIFRSVKRKNSSALKDKELCNGPSKLCQAFKIEKYFNKVDLCTSEELWLEDGIDIPVCDIIACKRIGIDSCGEEWANKPLRFYIKDCTWVSIKNKLAESFHKIDSN